MAADPDVTLPATGPSGRRGRVDARRAALLTFVFAGGLVAYAVHLVLVFWGAPAYCGAASRTLAVVTTVLMILGSAAAVLLGARALRRAAEDDRRREREGPAPVPAQELPAIPPPAWLLVAVGVLRSRPWRGEPRPVTTIAAAWDPAPASAGQRWVHVAGTFLSGLALLILLLVAASLVVLPPCV